jgi:hypothetical protein
VAARLWAAGQLEIENPDDEPADADEPTEAQSAAAALGLRIEEGEEGSDGAEPPARTFWLLPDALPLWIAWHRLQTQWRIGAGGERRGLDYAACTEWLRAHGWAHQRQRSLRHALDCLGDMERSALAVWAERAERDRRSNKLTR